MKSRISLLEDWAKQEDETEVSPDVAATVYEQVMAGIRQTMLETIRKEEKEAAEKEVQEVLTAVRAELAKVTAERDAMTALQAKLEGAMTDMRNASRQLETMLETERTEAKNERLEKQTELESERAKASGLEAKLAEMASRMSQLEKQLTEKPKVKPAVTPPLPSFRFEPKRDSSGRIIEVVAVPIK